MNKIVLATRNEGKARELSELLPDYQVLTLSDIGFTAEIEESATTLEGNAALKANAVFDFCKLPVLADDSGLEVEALQGRPGVYSARYAGEDGNAAANMRKLLAELEGIENRKAQFRTVLAYRDNSGILFYEGKCEGHITKSPKGSGGFGYDPVFIPIGYEITFAQMPVEVKNKISHRAFALRAFLAKQS